MSRSAPSSAARPRATIRGRRGGRTGADPGWTTADEQRVLSWLAGVVAGTPPSLGVLDDGLSRLLRLSRLDLLAYATGARDERQAARQLSAELKMRRLVAAAREAVGIAAAAGAPAVVLKGPGLGQRYWGDALLRESSDVDLLVRRSDVPAVRAALAAAGYATSPERVPPWYERRWFYHEALTRPEPGAPAVELHWDFMRSGFGSDDVGRLIDEAARVEVGGVELPVPSTAWQLVANAAHCVHEVFRSRQLLDVALVAREASADDTGYARELALAAGTGTLLFYAVAVSGMRLGWKVSPVLASLRPAAARDAIAWRYVDRVPRFAFPTRAMLQLHHLANPLLSCDGPSWVTKVPYALLTDRGNLAADVERLRRRLTGAR